MLRVGDEDDDDVAILEGDKEMRVSRSDHYILDGYVEGDVKYWIQPGEKHPEITSYKTIVTFELCIDSYMHLEPLTKKEESEQ